MELKSGKLVKATAREVEEIKSIYFSSTSKADASKKIIEKYDLRKAFRFEIDARNTAYTIIDACLYGYKYLNII